MSKTIRPNKQTYEALDALRGRLQATSPVHVSGRPVGARCHAPCTSNQHQLQALGLGRDTSTAATVCSWPRCALRGPGARARWPWSTAHPKPCSQGRSRADTSRLSQG